MLDGSVLNIFVYPCLTKSLLMRIIMGAGASTSAMLLGAGQGATARGEWLRRRASVGMMLLRRGAVFFCVMRVL